LVHYFNANVLIRLSYLNGNGGIIWGKVYGIINHAFKAVYRESAGKLLDQKLREIEISESDSLEVMQFIKFIRSSKVGIMRGLSDEDS